MRHRWAITAVTATAVLVGTSCGGSATRSTVPATAAHGTTPRTTGPVSSTTPSTSGEAALSVTIAPHPATVAVGVPVTFTVTIRGAGVLSGEDVHFGDGGTSGANAGEITCGQSARADHTGTYTHAYTAPGTYVMSDAVSVLGPPPTCTDIVRTGTTTVVVAAPAAQVTTGGAFGSPSGNLACQFPAAGTDRLRCVSFTPAVLVTMGPDGTYDTCSGPTCALGNPAIGTATLPYGSAAADGPFVCLSTTAGVTCTVARGTGFTISRGGVRAVADS